MHGTLSADQFLLDKILSDAKRLKALGNTNLAFEQNDPRFQPLAAIVASNFNAPVAQITLLGSETQWFKCSIGFDLLSSATETSFCAHAISVSQQPLIVLDTLKDSVFSQNLFVANPPYVRFYAGYPVYFQAQKVGTICVYDFEPRPSVSESQIAKLIEISKKATELIGILSGATDKNDNAA